MRTQDIVWTALPNGRDPSSGALRLSVFVMPRLRTDEGGESPRLSLFDDFANWPATVGAAPGGPLSFTVSFGTLPPVSATPAPGSLAPSPAHWAALFDPARTLVRPWQYYDWSSVVLWSFPALAVESFLRDAYGGIGRENPTTFPGRDSLLEGPFGPARPASLGPPRSVKGGGSQTLGPGQTVLPGGRALAPNLAIAQALDFHTRPPVDAGYRPPIPTLDFHEALSAIKAYPRLMRMLGLVFDLVVPVPAGLANGDTTVRVTPTWHPTLTGPGATSQDATPFTNCSLAGGRFQARPRGSDYGKGMLDLADTNRFSVVEVDVDGGAERAAMFAAVLEQTIAGGTDDTATDYAPPSLRSLGLEVVWNDWANTLNQLASIQTAKQDQLERSLTDPTVPAPAFDAEDLVRGHRFDVLTTSDQSPPWRSLLGRVGRYHFPANPGLDFSDEDEGTVVAGATQAAGTKEPPPPDLYVHETQARWSGWSLAARRPGSQILPGGDVGGDAGNPMAPPDPSGIVTPQLSATFAAPKGSLPKLRFGHEYRFRARAADLAGNGVPLSSTDSTAATPPARHLRFDPVVAPVLAPTAALGPGQGAQLLAILNFSNGTPVAPLGLWLFPPKVSQLLAEEHGMLDGFRRGSPPDRAEGPSGGAATYNLIVEREHTSLDDGTLPGFAKDPVRDTPYFTGSKLATPWLPDPLSAGVAMLGLPGDAGGEPTTRRWAGGLWPDPEPMLLRLSANAASGHVYQPSSAASSAVEAVTLAPAAVADVSLSSTLADDATRLLGMWLWITDGLGEGDADSLATKAYAGQVWLLTPFRVVRLVHAVRLPLVAPEFVDPLPLRPSGSHNVVLNDATFTVDTPSTGTLDVDATWTDPLDDPSDPANDPTTATTLHEVHAFQLTVADPSRPGPAFAFDEAHKAVHDIGDTKHHSVSYTATATSRFAEFFRQTVPVTFTTGNPARVSDLGLAPGSVRLTAGATELVSGTDFTVDSSKGEITLHKSGVPQPVSVSFVPTDTVVGPARRIEVLASRRPAPPKIARVMPAWIVHGPRGDLGDIVSGVVVERTGGYLRVYLDRPWFSSGAGELLGVVTMRDNAQVPNDAQRPLVTLVGSDPIVKSGRIDQSMNFSPDAVIPMVPYRPPYGYDRAVLGLAEDPGPFVVAPYEVHYDKQTGLWFADVRVLPTNPPTAAFFVRLALVRFQPFAVPGAEVSPVALATVAQPVPDRTAFVRLDESDASGQTVLVSVIGPAYSGWRPPVTKGSDGSPAAIQDGSTPYVRNPSFPPEFNVDATSAVVVEVQVQDTSTGLSGDLAWVRAPGSTGAPVRLMPNFSSDGSDRVVWGGKVPLPFPAPGAMRLRISEIDFFPSLTAPPFVDTSQRRPFFTFVSLA